MCDKKDCDCDGSCDGCEEDGCKTGDGSGCKKGNVKPKSDEEILKPINQRFNRLINSMSGLYEPITQQDIDERDQRVPYAGYLKDKEDCGPCGGCCGSCKK